MTRMVIKWDNNGSFSTFTDEAEDYLRDTFTMDLVNSEDYLYAGLFKPFDRLYAELNTANTNTSELDGEYWNGSTWTSLSELVDRSNGLARSGFIKWDRTQTDWATTSVDGVEKYWVRFSVDVTTTSMVFAGLNIIFADDNDMKEEFFEVADFLPTGESSFIAKHQATRKEMIQELRNKGSIKRNSSNKLSNIDQWDILDVDEIRQAGKFLSLSKIFLNISDAVEDKWFALGVSYKAKYQEAFNLFYFSLDTDDDGEVDNNERLRETRIRIINE